MKQRWQVLAIIFGAPLVLSGCMSPVAWWNSVYTKVKHHREVHVEYTALVKEHKDLKERYLQLEHKYHSLQNQVELTRKESLNHKITGDAEGRHLANYQAKVSSTEPESAKVADYKNLSLQEQFDLALQHASNKKFHDAYVLFESVLSSPEGAAFQSPTAFYQAGVSAYKIRNWKRAKQFFEAANSHAHSFKDFEVIRRSDLWLKVLNRTEVRQPASAESLPEEVKRPYGGQKIKSHEQKHESGKSHGHGSGHH